VKGGHRVFSFVNVIICRGNETCPGNLFQKEREKKKNKKERERRRRNIKGLKNSYKKH
jgi:hypothetical protein